MTQMKSSSHPLHHLLPSPLLNEPKYNLRRNSQKYTIFLRTQELVGRRERRTSLRLGKNYR